MEHVMAFDYKKEFSVEGKKCIVTGGYPEGWLRGFWKMGLRLC